MKLKSKKMLEDFFKKKEKAKNQKTVTKFKKISAHKTKVTVNDRVIGTVDQLLSGKWKLNPLFAPVQEDEYKLQREYDGPIEAGRMLASLYESYQKTLHSSLGYNRDLNGSLF